MINTNKTVVYYCDTFSNMFGELLVEPFGTSAYNVMDVDTKSGVNKCPAFRSEIKNLFSLPSPKDIDITRENGGFFSWRVMYGSHVDQSDLVHQRGDTCFCLQHQGLLFWCDEPMVMEYRHASFTETELSNKADTYFGSYDISQWIRPLDLCYKIKNDVKSLSIKRGDPLLFLKFHTEKTIVFKKFDATEEVRYLLYECAKTKQVDKTFFQSMANYYHLFKMRNFNKRVSAAIKKAVRE